MCKVERKTPFGKKRPQNMNTIYNRNNKIQKFIEIDLRKEAVSNPEKWLKIPPKYNI